ncbi:MAG TPA: hypothetical protein VFV33_18530, partial [Gemmatimonadaceae bacterium]|nr:hypothetical protein [Gemmatimonadaceae bacterium]
KRWHDAESRWENGDGRIGGSGRFDGGRTLLVAAPGADAWVRSEWRKSVSPGAGDITRIAFDRVTTSGRDSFAIAAGPAAAPDARPLPVALDSLCALVATARDLAADERCIANPVWVAPVGVEIAAEPAGAGTPGIAYRAGALRVTFRFPLSMSADAATRAFLRPLDGSGVSADPEIVLAPAPGWEDHEGIARSRYTVTNAADVPLPAHAWDAVSHTAARGVRSFVVYLQSPADVHGNRLNDIARAFTCPAPDPGAGARRKP